MHEELWQKILSFISHSIDADRFETWFKPVKLPIQNDPTTLIIEAPNQYMSDFLIHHYHSTLLSTARSFSSQIQFLSITATILASDLACPILDTTPPVLQKPDLRYSSSKTPLLLNERYSFDSFVVGGSNEFARSAAMAVADAPGKTKFNPLLLYGGVGLGKTHLIQAIGNFVLKNMIGSRVTYITSEDFYLGFIDAIKNNSTKLFTEKFRSSDLLLVDDIQFLAGKERTQEEFFFIFNTLHQNGRQIVLTSDLPPTLLKGLQDRLISRFQWGLCVDIQPPNMETRVAILKKKAEESNLNLPENVMYFIAENISSNVRQLEGVVLRLLAYSSIMKNDVSIELVKEVLKGTTTKEKTRISIDDIISIVADFYSIPINNIREKNRHKEVAHARQVAMYIAKNLTSFSLKTIGLNFGGRDHSTVIYAVSEVENNKATDSALAKEIEQLINIIETR